MIKISALLMFLVILEANAQSPHMVRTIMPDADTPAVIEWESNPAGVYSVEYSVGLNGDWTVIEEGFPSQGTTTRWTDRGNPSNDDFRFSSGESAAPYRFYRVREERLMDTTQPIVVTITSPIENATLADSMTVEGTVTAAQGIASVKLYVDGYLVSRTRGPSFSLLVETRHFSNGSHRLSVVAEDVGALESTEESESNPLASREASYGVRNVTVVFNNLLSNTRLRYEHFRPELGQTQGIVARWSEPRMWQVNIGTEDGSAVYRSFNGEGRRVALDWDGKDSQGNLLNPQLIGYFITDLGPGTEPPPGGGYLFSAQS